MQILYIFIGIVISTIVYLILLFLQGAKMADERNNHREMYIILNEILIKTDLIDENDRKPLEEYEQRFML